ncbi:hypothetical protein PVAP13_7KG314003 [Panicum virgatum]|uniref:Uncharacterized protein n=1 Tax=Panicum virgatum TaxID=38727 RepID=A0A8T0QP96_PANVG|nr:hypothetical protein PVAP13_7KG314003 [Panicum virgatum]
MVLRHWGLGYAYAGPRFDTGAGGEMFRWDGTHGSSGSPIATRHSPAVASKGYQLTRSIAVPGRRGHGGAIAVVLRGTVSVYACHLPICQVGEEEAEQTGHEIRPGLNTNLSIAFKPTRPSTRWSMGLGLHDAVPPCGPWALASWVIQDVFAISNR